MTFWGLSSRNILRHRTRNVLTALGIALSVLALYSILSFNGGFGIPDDDHLVRRVVQRGKAELEGLGVPLGPDDVLPELTLTAVGAFLHPFAPTVRNGVTDLDLCAASAPVVFDAALAAFLQETESRPAGDDVVRNVR